MVGSVIPLAFEGARVRLCPGFAWWRSASGQPGRNFDAEKMLFDAGRALSSYDLLAGFWRDDAGEMDWLEDFLCDPVMAQMIETLQLPETSDDDEEEVFYYNRAMLTTLGSDVVDST